MNVSSVSTLADVEVPVVGPGSHEVNQEASAAEGPRKPTRYGEREESTPQPCAHERLRYVSRQRGSQDGVACESCLVFWERQRSYLGGTALVLTGSVWLGLP